MKCNSNSELDMKDLQQLQEFVTPTKTATKCVLACAYKEAQIVSIRNFFDFIKYTLYHITSTAFNSLLLKYLTLEKWFLVNYNYACQMD